MPFEDLRDRVAEVRDRIDAAVRRGGHGQHVTVVAVTKTHGPDAVDAAFDAGLRDVGENRVQEALGKKPRVQRDVRWHLIGHLQRNKVKQIDAFDLIHSIDSERLAGAVDAHGRGRGRPVEVLVQTNVVGEETKGGLTPDDARRLAPRLRAMEGLRVRGVMTMAPLDADDETLRACFRGARETREALRAAGCEATILSMGMSNDYEVAVEEGATHVRLGTILFGARPA